MKQKYIALFFKKITLLSFLLFSIQFYAQTTITFDDQGWALNEDITTSLKSVNGFAFKFFVNNIEQAAGGNTITYDNDSGSGATGGFLPGFYWQSRIVITKTDDSAFKMISFYFEGGFSTNNGLIITGYKNNIATGAAQTVSAVAGGANVTVTLDVSKFQDVDKIIIDDNSGAFGFDGIFDHFIHTAAVSSSTVPTVTTTAASSITTTSATLGGNVTADGGETVTERGIVYSTSDTTPTIAEGATKDTNGSGTGVFSETVSSLTAGTTYYINSYATNSEGTSYGTATSFTTSSPTVTLSLSGSPLAENGGVATVTATLNTASSQTVTVTIGATGTATGSGTDYNLSSTTITINAGATTGTATITGVDDGLDESAETVIVDITGVTNGTESGTQQITASITDDDAAPTVTLGLSGSPLAENSGVATLTATLNTASSKTVTVTLGVTGTATGSGTDYTLSSTTITINAGATTGTATITGADDATVEGNETVIIDITGVTNATESGTQQVTATITDDDNALPTVTTTTQDIITTVSAVLGGNVTSDGGASVTERGIVWGTTSNPTIANNIEDNNIGTGVFSETVTSLPSNTTIYVRAYATNSAGTSYGNNISFTTEQSGTSNFITLGSPNSGGTGFKTNASNTNYVVSNIMSNDGSGMYINNFTDGVSQTFTIKADGTNAESFSVDVLNVRSYSLQTYDETSTVVFKDKSGATIQTMTLNADKELTANASTLFSFFDNGTATPVDLVAEIIFTMVPLDGDQNVSNWTPTDITISNVATPVASTTPTVTTTSASSITTTSATLGGNVTSNGGETVTERGIVYSTSDTTPTIGEGATKDTNGSGIGVFSETVSSLTTETTYYINSYAINSVGTSYGTATSFTTSSPTVTLGLSGSPLAENGGVATVTATLNTASSQTITVTIGATGTATGSGTDYNLSSTTITINAGATTGTATITGVDDALDEANETVIVDITGVANGTESGTQQVTASITDDDAAPTVTLGLSGSPLAENGGVATVTATLNTASSQTVTVTIGATGTATGSGTDYNLSSTTITINAGATTGTATITGVDDALDETSETVIVDITGVANGTELGTQQVTASLTDDDAAPTVTLSLSGSPLAENGGVATVTATLNTASSQTVTVTIDPTGTATGSGTDYTLSSTTITINAGASTGTATITGVDDALDETSETVIVNITGVANGTESGTQQVTASITDDDTAPTVTLGLSGSPLAENGGVATITASLNTASGQNVVVTINPSGTAIGSAVDYSLSSSTITINAGDISGTATITGADDALDEPSETVIIDITGVANGTESGTQQVTASITDDDAAPTVTLGLSGSPLAENGGVATVTATLNTASSQTVTVTIGATGTATGSGTDYTLSSTTITISAGTTTGTATITGADDAIAETAETVIIDITGVANGTESGVQQVTASITDDELITPTITFANITKTYVDANFNLGATSNSGGTITYSIEGVNTTGTTLGGTNNETVTLGTVGSLTIRATQAANGSFSSTTKDIIVTINKATLTVTAADKSKDYGAANPVFTFSYSGFKNSETSAVLTTGPSVSSIATLITNVGTVDIDLAGGVDDNYNFNYVKGTLTIGKATLTITAANKSKEYGAVNPTFTYSYGGFKNSETSAVLTSEPTASSIATTTTNAGTVDIDVAGGLDNNYDFLYIKGTLTIGKIAITITADANQNKTSGDTDPVFTYQITSGSLLGGDSFSGALSREVGELVGPYAIQIGTLSAGTNYDLSFVSNDFIISVVLTTGYINRSSKAVIIKGRISSSLGVIERGVVYSATNTNPVIGGADVTKVVDNTTTGPFNVTVTGLNSNTTYYFQTYVISNVAKASAATTFFGGVQNFTTLVAEPLLVAKNPVTGSLLVDPQLTISLAFDKDMQVGNGEVLIKKTSDDSLIETIDVTSGNITIKNDVVQINPTADLPQKTELYVIVPVGAFEDLSANSWTGILNKTDWTFTTDDTTDPVVTGTTPTDNATDVAPSADLTITFSEDIVKGTGNILIKKTSDDTVIATLDVTSSEVSIANNVVTVNPTTDLPSEVDLYIQVPNTAFKDLYNNAYAGFTNKTTWNFTTDDITAPTVVISSTVANQTNMPFTVVFTFSESVTNFDLSDVTVSNATASIFNQLNSTTYTAVIIPTAEGNVTVDLAAGKLQDLSNNDNTASNTFSITYDITQPSLSITSDTTDPTNVSSFVATFTFSEDVADFDASYFTLTNATSSDFVSVSDAVYTATITPTSDGSVAINVAADETEDNANNGNTAGQYSTFVDTVKPTVVISSTVANPTNGTFITTFTFSEYITGFEVNDITLGNATVSDFTNISVVDKKKASTVSGGTKYTALITPIADGEVTIAIAADVANDLATNENTVATQFSTLYDATKPAVTISSTAANATNTTFTTSFIFDEDITGFDISDISLGNATASNFSATSASVYTALITPAAEGNVTVDVAADVATDAATNGNTAATQFSIRYDITNPTVVLSSPAANPTNTAFTTTVTFSEDVTGFEISDITLTNATASDFTATSAAVYTAVITPTADGEVTVDLAADVAADAATNGNTIAIQLSTLYDATAPDMPIVVTIDSYTCAGNTSTTADTTLVFSGTAEADSTVEVFVNNTSVGTTEATSAGAWSFDHTGVTLTDGTYNLTATATDAATNTSDMSAGFSIIVDTKDFDGDGNPDFCDTDDDNDGVLDVDDNSYLPNPDQLDTDGDGLADVEEDCDNDGTVNYYDTDVASCQDTIVMKEKYGFSPNGDGINDTWVVENIQLFPNNVVHIYNRSGKLVYTMKGYDNSFNGFSNKTSSGKKLPVGAYYFTVEFNTPGAKPAKGWIYINY